MDFKINNKTTEDFGIFIKTSNYLEMFEKQREIINIPGRTGDLIIEDGSYKNKDLIIEAYTYSENNICEKLIAIENWLTTSDYSVLEFKNKNNLEAYYLKIYEIVELAENRIEFKIHFTCRRRYNDTKNF